MYEQCTNYEMMYTNKLMTGFESLILSKLTGISLDFLCITLCTVRILIDSNKLPSNIHLQITIWIIY